MIKVYHCDEIPISNWAKNVTHTAVCFKLFLAKHNVQMIEKFHTETSDAHLFFLLSTCMERSFSQKKVTNPRAGEPPAPHIQYSCLGKSSEDFLMGAGGVGWVLKVRL